ncbi:MAG: HK97 family phage prohead protease [Tepidisphaeraceae bacterium]
METKQLERRDLGVFATVDNTELRFADAEQPNRLVGYAAVFNSLSADLGGFRERIRSGAFARSIGSGSDIRALVDHDPSKLLARTSAGTLRLSEDQVGLRIELDLPDVSYANDIRSLIKRGDIKGMSFGFVVPKGGATYSRDSGQVIRELSDISLREVTVTSIPAYGDTSVYVRSAVIDPDIMTSIERPNYTSRAMQLRRLLSGV